MQLLKWWRRRGKTKTNHLNIRLQAGDILDAHLTPAGDLTLCFGDEDTAHPTQIYILNGNAIPVLARWLSGVEGRYSYVSAGSLQLSAPVLPLFGTKARPGGPSSYDEWLAE